MNTRGIFTPNRKMLTNRAPCRAEMPANSKSDKTIGNMGGYFIIGSSSPSPYGMEKPFPEAKLLALDTYWNVSEINPAPHLVLYQTKNMPITMIKATKNTRAKWFNETFFIASGSLSTKPCCRAAIHDQCLSRHKRGLLVIGKEIDRAGDLFGLAHLAVDRLP